MTSISSGAFSSSVTGCEWKGTEPSSCRCSRHPVRIEPSGYRRSRYMNSDVTRCASLNSGSRRPHGVTTLGVHVTSRHVLYARNVRRELTKRASRRVPEITPHELRHTAASLMVDDGQALEQVADYLGRRSTRMLESTYRHRVRPSADAAVETMDRVFGPRQSEPLNAEADATDPPDSDRRARCGRTSRIGRLVRCGVGRNREPWHPGINDVVPDFARRRALPVPLS